MKRSVIVGVFVMLSLGGWAQGFEVSGIKDTYQGFIGELLKAPLRFKNLTDKPITIVVHKAESQLGSTQKSFYCIGENCLGEFTEEFQVKLEPGQVVDNVSIGLETGLVSGASTARYIAYMRSNPVETTPIELNFEIEERPNKTNIYSSPVITLYDVYPNPVVDFAQFQYQILSDKTQARIVIHNILGNPIAEYDLNRNETKLKIRTDEFNAGIYFYSLYVDKEMTITRKLIVRK